MEELEALMHGWVLASLDVAVAESLVDDAIQRQRDAGWRLRKAKTAWDMAVEKRRVAGLALVL